MQGTHRIGKDERGEHIERRLFRHAQQCRKDDLLRLLLDDFENGSPLDSILVLELLKYRRLEDTKADPQADADEYDRQRERNSPAPDGELIARPLAEGQYRKIR